MYDCRIYRQANTGAVAQLIVDRVPGPGGELWWRVQLLPANNLVDPVAGQMAVEWARTREQAREVYRERLRALREAGWVRVE
jgi:hypothetical protein